MNWKVLFLLLCAFGFVKEMRPSEAFLTLYLTGPWKNLTIEQVSNEIYPWWTYSYLIWLVPVFLLTDFLRYKPILIAEAAAAIGTWALLLWAQGVTAMKFVEVLYGLFTAGEVAYYSYLYVEVPREHFKKIASFTRAATLVGKFVSFLLAQLLYSFRVMDYYDQHVFSFISVCVAFVIPLVLPWPKHSEIFHRTGTGNTPKDEKDGVVREKETAGNKDTDQQIVDENGVVNLNKIARRNDTDRQDVNNITDQINAVVNVKNKAENSIDISVISYSEQQTVSDSNPETKHHVCKDGFLFMWREIKTIYSSRIVVIWSIWWAIASCGNLQVLNYVQNLWATISQVDSPGGDDDVYNGAVEAVSTLLGSITVMSVGFVPLDWSRRAEIFMAIVCAGNAIFLFIMAYTSSIWVAYGMYVLFRTSYVTVITIATAQIAENLVKQRYGLVFGCNMFASLVLESILTLVVVDKAGLGAGVVDQFTVYGGYFGFISIVFAVAAVVHCVRPRRQSADLETYL